jgi:uncharacterized protein with beta-barrel porin domain
VAAALLCGARPAAAQTIPAGCTSIGSVLTCTGNRAAGVELDTVGFASTYTTLNVVNLSTDIAPAAGVPGIVFTSDDAVMLNVATPPFGIFTTGDDAPGIFAGSDNGSVSINAFADIATTGNLSHGIAAESIGGTEVTWAGTIMTEGDDSRGIWAESDSGNVTVEAAGTITTGGEDADGIWTFSSTGAVEVNSAADIITTGENSPGISVSAGTTAVVRSWGNVFATGLGSPGITVDADQVQVDNYGRVLGGPCCGGVMVSGTTSALIRNFGTIIGDPSGEAIFAVGDDALVENYGTVTGNVIMFGGSSSVFNNHAGALFNSGETVMADTVLNEGIIAPGGRGVVLLSGTMISNYFTQGSTGIYAVDIDPAASVDRSDLIVVSNTAQLAGNVAVHLLSLPVNPVDAFLILTAGTVSDNDLGVIASPALHATLISDAANVTLAIGVAFDGMSGLSANQRAIAGGVQRLYAGGAGGIAPVLLGLLNTQNFGAYSDALDQLSPEVYSEAAISALFATQAFAGSLLSCRVNGTDTASIIREGQCLWAGASARFLDTGTTAQQIGFSETAGLFTAGAQVALDDVWRLGLAGGFQSSTLQTATGAQSEGVLGQAGVAIKYNPGPLLLAGALTGGGATYDTRRPLSFGGFTGVAEGDQDLGIFSGTLRAAYVLGSPHLYFKPMLDANLTQLQLGGFAETGSAALSVEGGGHTVFALTPSVEAGTEWWLANGTLVRPLLHAGLVWYADPDLALTSSFVDAPLGIAPFTIRTDMDEVMGLVGAGIEVISSEDAVMRLSYDGQLGETTQIHSVGIKGSARF